MNSNEPNWCPEHQTWEGAPPEGTDAVHHPPTPQQEQPVQPPPPMPWHEPAPTEPKTYEAMPGQINPRDFDFETGRPRTESATAVQMPLPFLGLTCNVPIPIDERVHILIVDRNGPLATTFKDVARADSSIAVWAPQMIRALMARNEALS